STATISSIMSLCLAKIPGTNPSEIPSMRCLPTSPHIRMHDSLGSTATTRQAALRSLKHWPTPAIVPPVPTPPDHGVGDRAVRDLAQCLRPEPGAVLLDVPLRVE